MLKHVLTEHWKYEDQLKNRWNENTASIMIIMEMMDSKRRIKDTNMQIISKQADSSLATIAGIRDSHGGTLDMKMNMMDRGVLDMKKDTMGPMGGILAINRTTDMSLTNGK